ncbi:MAG: hypothetical protein K9K88_09860 [Desulfobacterales bacterium]|nr:hypothetical protein [Desulfobacterales bacterium]
MAKRRFPKRLETGNRPIDPDFNTEERLFQRFNALLEVNGAFYPNSIRFPEFSVNREKYSRPEDVLLPDFDDLGIAAYRVGDIPGPLKTPGGGTNTTYTFGPVHDPIPGNYSHSEVRTYLNGVYKRKKIKSSIIKLEFKARLSEKMEIIKHPDQ